MPKKSSISRLPKEIKDGVQLLIRQGCSIDEITAHLHQLDQNVSRSSVGRYTKKVGDTMRRYAEAQEIAASCIAKLGENPNGDVGRLLAEMLKSLAFQFMANKGDEEVDTLDAKDIMFLAKSIKDLEGANKLSIEREKTIRAEVAKLAANTAEKIAVSKGLSKADANFLRAEILGINVDG